MKGALPMGLDHTGDETRQFGYGFVAAIAEDSTGKWNAGEWGAGAHAGQCVGWEVMTLYSCNRLREQGCRPRFGAVSANQ